MTTYRLSADGWVPHVPTPGKWKKYYAAQAAGQSSHVPDPDKWRKYFAAQGAGRPTPKTSPIKDIAKKEPQPVTVKVVSDIQDTYDRAIVVIKHKQKKEKQMRTELKYDLKIPARKQRTVVKA